VSARLTREELTIIWALRDAGVAVPEATLAVIMITRGHARPEGELADIIRQYQNLEDRTVSEEAIAQLKAKGWLVVSKSYDQNLIHQAPDLKEKLAETLEDPSLPNQLSKLRSTLERNIRILGSMNDQFVYGSYLDLLRTAQREICLPMLATSPHLSSVPILQERARRGVHVRILLGAPEIVAKLRGQTFVAMARDSISGWAENARGIERMEVRVAHSFENMFIATSMSIDEHILRFDVYDPLRQRSLEGIMLEVESPVGLQFNLVSLFQIYFNDAWNQAEPVQRFGKVRWWLTRGWQWWAFILSTIIAFMLSASFWGGIVGSVAATFLVNALVSSWPTIHSLIRRMRDD